MSKRITIKMINIRDTPEGREAAEAVATWKARREWAGHFVRAVRVYWGLMRGDTTALREYFPWVGTGQPAIQLPNANMPTGKLQAVEIRRTAEELDQAMGDDLGVGEIEF